MGHSFIYLLTVQSSKSQYSTMPGELWIPVCPLVCTHQVFYFYMNFLNEYEFLNLVLSFFPFGPPSNHWVLPGAFL